MGGHLYNHQSRTERAIDSGYYTKSIQEVSVSKRMPVSMDPKNITIRECRDSDVHPQTLPIIICLDVTGSMLGVPQYLIRDGLPKLVSNLTELGITDPSILFVAVGDHFTDEAPLQVAQFESGDAELDKWLTTVYLEQGGGGNGGESYLLPWYFAAKYCITDAWEKRGQKGILITIGDEACHSNIHKDDMKRIFSGDELPSTLTAKEVLDMAQERWCCQHIRLGFMTQGQTKYVTNSWNELIPEHFVAKSESDVVDVITKIVNNGCINQTTSVNQTINIGVNTSDIIL